LVALNRPKTAKQRRRFESLQFVLDESLHHLV
jgi:hypothetical protein